MLNKRYFCGFVAGIAIMIMVSGCGSEERKPESKPMPQTPPAKSTAKSQTGKADYSGYLTVAELQSITGRTNLKLKSLDAQKSGEMADLTYITAEGQVILTVQVLNGSDYEKAYHDLRCQDYKGMEYAFWGPKEATPANPPTLLGFRNKNTFILLDGKYESKNKSFLTVEMMEKIAKTIESRM
jgi:hypothetical protein